jgi:hypothetical protein
MALACNVGCEFTRSIKGKTGRDARTCGKFRCLFAALIGPLTMPFIDKMQCGAQSFPCEPNWSNRLNRRIRDHIKGGIRW